MVDIMKKIDSEEINESKIEADNEKLATFFK